MVQKKTNYHTVNSGNTMRKRYFKQRFQKHMANFTHVIKCILNIPAVNLLDEEDWEVKTAEEYIDDGGLKPSVSLHRWYGVDKEVYTMNKRKRWLLDDIVADAVLNEGLANESFKVTLVHRIVPSYGVYKYTNSTCNVTHYYDSHGKWPKVQSCKSRSTRHDLAQKAAQGETLDRRRLLQKKRRPYHNQHFRGIQRKRTKTKKDSSETPNNAVRDDEPEIRYEIAEPEPVTSLHLRNWEPDYRPYSNQQPGTRFRGFHREKVEWYYPDAVLDLPYRNAQCKQITAEIPYEGASVCEEGEEDTESLWCPPPLQQEFSLLDLAFASAHRHQQKVNRKPSTTAEKHLVNPASGQIVKKHGKGTAIVLQQQHPDLLETPDDSLDFTDINVTDHDTDDDSGMHSNEENDLSSLEGVSRPVVDYEGELEQFDKSFTSCGIPASQLKISYLQSMFEGAVQFAKCVPLTMTFDLQAVWLAQRRQGEDEGFVAGGEEMEGWWLLCQAGESSGDWNSSGTGDVHGDIELVKLRLYSSSAESDVASANEDVRHQVTCEQSSLMVLSVTSLLDTVCQVVSQCVLNRQRDSECGCSAAVSSRRQRHLDVHLPHERYTEQVDVCTVREAYLHLQTDNPHSSKGTMLEELDLSCGAEWCSVECAICFTHVDDRQTAQHGFSFSVAMTTCGHTFCRRCWQHHLVSSVMEGKTTVHCMEYKCETEVDSPTLMSLVPQRVYSRWQHHVHNKTVERSRQWTWCPNPRCGLLARAPAAEDSGQEAEEKQGVPVICQCHKRWCLDCGRDAHWPITCAQFLTYTKMLRQNGEEEGMKTSYQEITSVKVKRCPFCQYPIEKNGGCSHMYCSQCRSSFCWVCRKNWSEHVVGDWRGCRDQGEETIDLENKRMYPLPVECYKTAVSYRYTWKLLDRQQHRAIATFLNNYAFSRSKGRRVDETLHDDAPKRVVDAFQFLKKGNMLLELTFILLSNSPRHHPQARLLPAALNQLDFFCGRVAQYLERPTKQVLRNSEALHTLTCYGDQQIHHVCFLAHCLVSRLHNTTTQQWLLEADHERFVRYK